MTEEESAKKKSKKKKIITGIIVISITVVSVIGLSIYTKIQEIQSMNGLEATFYTIETMAKIKGDDSGAREIFSLLREITHSKEKKPMLWQEKRRMKAYLEDQYEEKFKIKSIKFFVKSLGAKQEIIAEASPVNNPEITFEISRLVDAKDLTRCYGERYENIVWENEFKEKFNDFLVKEKITFYKLDSNFWCHENVVGKVISYDELMRRYGGKNMSCSVSLDVIGQYNENNKNNYERDILKVIKYLQTLGIKEKDMEYNIYPVKGMPFKHDTRYTFNSKEIIDTNEIDDVNRCIYMENGVYKDVR